MITYILSISLLLATIFVFLVALVEAIEQDKQSGIDEVRRIEMQDKRRKDRKEV